MMGRFDFGSGDDDAGERLEQMAAFFSPGQVDQMIRQAIQMAWMSLPKERRTVEHTETVVRHLVDRALKDLREDGITFGG